MLQHERETRNFVKDIITEQRHSFLSEFDKISRNVQASGRPNHTLTTEDIERKLQANMDAILSELRKSQFTRQDSADSNKENVDQLERERKKLRDYERQIERREDKLTLREDKLLANEERVSVLYASKSVRVRVRASESVRTPLYVDVKWTRDIHPCVCVKAAMGYDLFLHTNCYDKFDLISYYTDMYYHHTHSSLC